MKCRSLHIYFTALLVKPSTTVLAFLPSHRVSSRVDCSLRDSDISVDEALKRTSSHLEKLKKQIPTNIDSEQGPSHDAAYKEYLKYPGNALKSELKSRGLPQKGRKPDLARRLADSDLNIVSIDTGKGVMGADPIAWDGIQEENKSQIQNFCGLNLSEAAGKALGNAKFHSPSPIQKTAIPTLARGKSAILYAETGSGKTLAYLLPVTEQLWAEVDEDEASAGFCVILTPTRELASQVAGIATVLAPPGSVRLVSQPTNLLADPTKDRGELPTGGRITPDGDKKPRIFVGSAKSIMGSLFGDGKMPASPTSKPEAKWFLQNNRWLILDEVDRMLNVKTTRAKQKNKVHEKPAAIVTSSVTRLTLGKSQIVAASATVGRPLKRELARVLGLPPQDCPPVLKGSDESIPQQDEVQTEGQHVGRAVTIPSTVQNYAYAVEGGQSSGKLLTSSFFVIKSLLTRPRRILMVLTRDLNLSTKNAIGALKHFGCTPEPKSLLDALEADGTDEMIEVYREVTGAKGVGESYFNSAPVDEEEMDIGEGYLLVTGEDTIRGLHLDGLDVVIVVGRPRGPDEYTHIAGRTGRAGRIGKVINVVSSENAAALTSWEKMLDVDFVRLEMDDIARLD